MLFRGVFSLEGLESVLSVVMIDGELGVQVAHSERSVESGGRRGLSSVREVRDVQR